MFALLVYHLLIVVVDRVSRLPRSGVQPEVERILSENLALKAQVRALVLELKSERPAEDRQPALGRAPDQGRARSHGGQGQRAHDPEGAAGGRLPAHRRPPAEPRQMAGRGQGRHLGARLLLRPHSQGRLAHALLVVDLHTKEILELRACDAWGPTAEWTIRTFAAAIHREGRQPGAVIHDHGTDFLGQFERQLRVLEIERRRTPVALPFVNRTAERAIKSVRLEMLNHIRVRDVEELQWFLDEYRAFYNDHRARPPRGRRRRPSVAAHRAPT